MNCVISVKRALRRLIGGASFSKSAAGSLASDYEAQFTLPSIRVEDMVDVDSRLPLQFYSGQIRSHRWQTPLDELAILGTLCRGMQPENIFEIGTYTGAATLTIAANCNAQRIVTLDFNPRKMLPAEEAANWPDYESGQLFLGTPYESRITQVLADSQSYDFSLYCGQFDLVFVDAVHQFDAVLSDTKNALRLLRAGGRILWHDYRWEPADSECAGVTKCVHLCNELGVECFQIANSRFAVTGPIVDPGAIVLASQASRVVGCR